MFGCLGPREIAVDDLDAGSTVLRSQEHLYRARLRGQYIRSDEPPAEEESVRRLEL
jgi:hypothetical protein